MFSTSILQTLLSLYGFGAKPAGRRRPAPVVIGDRPSLRRLG